MPFIMDELLPSGPDQRRFVRLSTLIRLRWLAIGGQLLAIGMVSLALGFSMPVLPCLMLVTCSVFLNVYLSLRYPATQRLKPTRAAVLLGYDICQLGALLMLTGGLMNPFALLIIVPVVVAAGAMPVGHTAVLAELTALIVVGLLLYHLPLPWVPDETLTIPPILTAGMALAILCTMAFAALYAGRVASEARDLSDALAATELVLQREQHLSAIDGLAAATAHELGTPLGTIAVIAKEMERSLGKDERHKEDVALLRSQSERCRDILRRLTSLSAESEALMQSVSLHAIVEEAVLPHREFGIAIHVEQGKAEGPEPIARRNPGLIYSIGNLVENAVDFAKSEVRINPSWTKDKVTLTIIDDGAGYPPSIIDHIGEPYRSHRPHSGDSETAQSAGGGLGLGLFIAKTLIERSGAQIAFSNAFDDKLGARIVLQWPRAVFERNETLGNGFANAPMRQNEREPNMVIAT
jgi:two-component system, sensor histidine kinase RegB